MKFLFTVFFSFAMILFGSLNLSAQNLERQKILPSEIAASGKNEFNHIFTENDAKPKFIPKTAFENEIKNFAFGKINTAEMGYAAEKLYVVKKSSIENVNKNEFNIDSVSKIMRSISKMTGMQYFSRSREEWNTLYNKTYRVENPDAKKLIPAKDIVTGNANGQIIYALLDDHTFGECVYKITYKQNQNELVMFMENYSYLSYGPIKAVKPGNLKMCVSIADCGDEFLFYIGNYTEFKMISALKGRLNNSFEARLEAIFNWFKKQF